jgi:hypothetical protein
MDDTALVFTFQMHKAVQEDYCARSDFRANKPGGLFKQVN